jgi:hypothetical protein
MMFMDAVITRIIEIEKQSTLDIERAENDSLKNIDEHKRFLAVGKGFESRLQDTVTVGAVKEKIVAILLAG